jgi:hypothetical protein
MDNKNNRIQIREELLLAKQSRIEGNEGRARVCARRAAGAAVKLHLEKKELISPAESALQSLMIFRTAYELPERVKTAVNWLVQRVDENYRLPVEVDLINEAHLVLKYLEEIDPGINGETWV